MKNGESVVLRCRNAWISPRRAAVSEEPLPRGHDESRQKTKTFQTHILHKHLLDPEEELSPPPPSTTTPKKSKKTYEI